MVSARNRDPVIHLPINPFERHMVVRRARVSDRQRYLLSLRISSVSTRHIAVRGEHRSPGGLDPAAVLVFCGSFVRSLLGRERARI
jgi:hypothetical protein